MTEREEAALNPITRTFHEGVMLEIPTSIIARAMIAQGIAAFEQCEEPSATALRFEVVAATLRERAAGAIRR